MNTKFESAAQAYETLFANDHKEIMAERKALKAGIDKALAEYRAKVAELEAKDKANWDAWKAAQAELKEGRIAAKAAKDSKVETKVEA